jgi:hypothetical protein
LTPHLPRRFDRREVLAMHAFKEEETAAVEGLATLLKLIEEEKIFAYQSCCSPVVQYRLQFNSKITKMANKGRQNELVAYEGTSIFHWKIRDWSYIIWYIRNFLKVLLQVSF